MSIRRRLALGFVTILTLFAVNEAIQLWSARVRAGSMDTLDRALTIQAHMASVFHEVDNLHKQMSLMGQQMDSASPTSEVDDDIARVAVFLASPDAGYLTGQVLTVDGGLSLGAVSH